MGAHDFVIQLNLGGGIVAHNTSLPELQKRVNDDPFVVENVVSAEIIEISPSKADEQLGFLARKHGHPLIGLLISC